MRHTKMSKMEIEAELMFINIRDGGGSYDTIANFAKQYARDAIAEFQRTGKMP